MNPMFFFYLTAAAMLFLVVSLFLGYVDQADFGHAGDAVDLDDVGGDVDVADGGDSSSADQDAGADGGENMSIWSFQVLFLFIGGFGIGGYFASIAYLNVALTMLSASLGGVALASIGYSALNFFYRRQYDSTVRSDQYIGSTGIVVTSINAGNIGRVRCEFGANRQTFLARSADGTTIPINSTVRVVDLVGSTAIVEPAESGEEIRPIWRS
jgi:membrane protein implicated in regulation of membrane protease activity